MAEGSEEGPRTLYINNLNERATQTQLRRELGKLCEKFGPIAAIYTGKGIRKRGQAFVAFHNSADAESALSQLQSQTFLAKPLKVAFSHNTSDLHSDPQTVESRKRKRDTTRQNLKPNVDSSGDSENSGLTAKPEVVDVERTVPKEPASFGEPHNVLLLQKIPDSITLSDLQSTCEGLNGFVEARMFAVKHVGFLEFESVDAAQTAITFISQKDVGSVTYAKK